MDLDSGCSPDLSRPAFARAPVDQWHDRLHHLPRSSRPDKPTFKCLDCHSEIASAHCGAKGLHAAYNIKPGSSLECVNCHSEHNGEDFALDKWDLKTFDHGQTGYGLEGKHSGLDCNQCHTPEHCRRK